MTDERLLSLIACLDLTDLTPDLPEDRVRALTRQAASPASEGPAAAAVCVHGSNIAKLRAAIEGTVRVAAATGDFPSGRAPLADRVAEIERVIADGADEIDAPLRSELLAGRDDDIVREVQALRRGATGVVLKIIIESGHRGSVAEIERVARAVYEGGADFVKTSTGTTPAGATPEAARAIARVAAGYPGAGLKMSGGIATVEEALDYCDIVVAELGSDAVRPERFRVGASRLLESLVRAL